MKNKVLNYPTFPGKSVKYIISKKGVSMKKLLAVLCFVPVGLMVLAAIGALLAIVVKQIPLLLTNPLSFLIAMGLVAGLMLAFAAFFYGIPKLTALGARLWRGEKSKNG